jgi:hypothetical protein
MGRNGRLCLPIFQNSLQLTKQLRSRFIARAIKLGVESDLVVIDGSWLMTSKDRL